MATVGEKMTAIANAIRTKTGGTDKLTLDTMASSLNNIPERTSSNLSASGATVTVPAGNYKAQATKSVATVARADTAISVSADDTNDKLTITASNNQGTGYVTGANKTATKTISLTASGATVSASDGTNTISKSVSTATQATPSVSINSSGLITASATQYAGYVYAGTKSGTKQLTTQAAKTVTPSSTVQTAVNSGVYTTGDIKVAPIPSSYVQLNFTVVGGTYQPSNPAENTIWVNTQTTISGWSFIAEKPTWSMAAGYVCFVAETSTNNTKADFNALKSNEIWINPVNAWQYVNNSWVQKVVKIYKNNAWVDLIEVIDFDLTNWTKKNPYPSRTYAMGSYDLSNKTLKGYVTGSYRHVVLVKNEKVNFSSSNQLKFVYSLSRNLSSYGAIIVKVSSSNSDPTDASCVVNQQIIEYATNTEVAIDVSFLSSSYYLWIGLAVWGSAGTVNFEVSNLHLL